MSDDDTRAARGRQAEAVDAWLRGQGVTDEREAALEARFSNAAGFGRDVPGTPAVSDLGIVVEALEYLAQMYRMNSDQPGELAGKELPQLLAKAARADAELKHLVRQKRTAARQSGT